MDKVETSVLGDIYEQFLARQIALSADRNVQFVEKPEVVQSGGVVSTPKYIVDQIIERALQPLCAGRSPDELTTFRVADIACGSGGFLLAAYEYLADSHLEWYLQDGIEKHRDKILDLGNGQFRLTLVEKQRILLNSIFGVDIDMQAVEIARFSLMLKVLEGESAASIDTHLERSGTRALPNLNRNIQCGNSLVDSTYFTYDQAALNGGEQLVAINPFDWRDAFPLIFREGGFDVIVGNPPYIRIQNMVRYSAQEAGYYQSQLSPYTTARSDNFDKYALFIERALTLLKSHRSLGYIVPHKFFTIKAGTALRRLLANGHCLNQIVHFGVQQVFPGRSTYTCLLILGDSGREHFMVEHTADINAWRYGNSGAVQRYATNTLDETPWIFVPPQTHELFERWRNNHPTQPLEDVADIFVGVQTSNDRVYIFRPERESDDDVQFRDRAGRTWTIERAILRPCLLDVPFTPFGTPAPNSYIIFPYRVEENRPVLFSPDEMQERFPRCWAYLNAFREELTKRSIQYLTPDTWYRYGRSQSLTRFNGEPKLLWPVLSTVPRYVYDNSNIVFTGGGNGPYYGLRPKAAEQVSLYYLQAILYHPLVELMVRSRASTFRGGYVSHGKQFIANIPIRTIDFSKAEERTSHDEIVSLVQRLISTTTRIAAASVPHTRTLLTREYTALFRQLMEKVERLYGITENDMELLNEITTPED